MEVYVDEESAVNEEHKMAKFRSTKHTELWGKGRGWKEKIKVAKINDFSSYLFHNFFPLFLLLLWFLFLFILLLLRFFSFLRFVSLHFNVFIPFYYQRLLVVIKACRTGPKITKNYDGKRCDGLREVFFFLRLDGCGRWWLSTLVNALKRSAMREESFFFAWKIYKNQKMNIKARVHIFLFPRIFFFCYFILF